MADAMSLDWETRSDVDLLKHGIYRYVESPHTDILMASYRMDDGPVLRWRPGQPCPDDIVAHVLAGGEIKAFNAAFERLIWWHVACPKHGWPRPSLAQFRCTAVAAAAMSLPRSLDRLGQALNLAVKKDKKGRALIKRYSTPAGWDGNRPLWNEDEEGLEEFRSYCDTDVLTEAEADRRLIPLSEQEQAVYVLTETINDRGIRLDVRSARSAVEMIEAAKRKINAELHTLTDGEVSAVTQVAALKRWIEEQGVEMPSMDKDDVEEFLMLADVPERVHRALELRQEGAKPSVEKISAMLDRVCADGRLKGAYLHHGAGQTGRFSSRGFQAHNMPKLRKAFEAANPRPDILFEVIRSGDPDFVEFMYGPELGRPLHLLSDAIRGFLWAAPGHDLIDADYISIEGVMAAWFTKEEWKLEAFKAVFRGEGYGIYEQAAAGIYGIPVEEVTKSHRPTGKVAELSCQYQTGAGGIRKFARQNKVKLPSLYPALWAAADEERREFAEKRFADRVAKHDPNAEALGREGWIAAELIKVGWRAKHPKIVQGWSLLETAATATVQERGSVTEALGVKYQVAHGFLWALLPSGRCLAYGNPQIREVEAPWADKTVEKEKRETKQAVTVMGVDSQSERWVRYSIYGGSLFNNVVQGSARDILVNGKFKAEAAGYPIVLHTHDELAAEVPKGWGDVKEFERLICELPAWAEGLPLKAEGWRGKRYRK
jgi:DNA polymerase